MAVNFLVNNEQFAGLSRLHVTKDIKNLHEIIAFLDQIKVFLLEIKYQVRHFY